MSRLQSNYDYSPNSKSYQQPVPFQVEVVFGVPGKNCNGVGICRISSIDHARVNWKCPHAYAWMGAALDGSLTLSFERSRLPQAVCERYFGEQNFQIEEAYPIPAAILSRLNLPSFVVKPGPHPIQVSELFFIVTL